MNTLKVKSELYFDAGKLLVENNYYTQSVHCFYYGVFQKMKYTIMHKKGLDYTSYDKASENQSSHNYLINEIANYFSCKLTKRDYKNRILDLKEFRVKCDYYGEVIDIDKANQLETKSEELIKIINKI